MRTFAALLLIGMTAALAASAPAQTNDPANPTAPGPVPSPLDAPYPPAHAGCGEGGLTASQNRPTVRLASATLRLRDTGNVRIFVRANQSSATKVKIAQVGGKRVGGTVPGSYTCANPEKILVSAPLNNYGRKLVRRHGRLAVKITFRLINGSGITNKRVLSGVVKPE
ncbi:MAG: hypothetical protein Q8K79_07420 [Solirubrobacteraceae bacterium]|nr:hypothetical protein [Solirubrobacteraceae bacterium]